METRSLYYNRRGLPLCGSQKAQIEIGDVYGGYDPLRRLRSSEATHDTKTCDAYDGHEPLRRPRSSEAMKGYTTTTTINTCSDYDLARAKSSPTVEAQRNKN